MKRSHDEINLSASDDERNRKVRMTSYQVMIILDETIGSKLLNHKFKYQTTELQLFLQHVPVLLWYPLDVIGTINFKYNIDSCVFSAAVRHPLHKIKHDKMEGMSRRKRDAICEKSLLELLELSTIDIINTMSSKLGKGWDGCGLFERIYCLKMDENLEKRKLCTLLKSLLDDELFILQVCEKHGVPLEFTDRFKHNEKFIEKVTKQIINFYQPRSTPKVVKVEEIKSDIMECDESIRIYLDQVKKNGLVLQHLTDRLKDNEQIVLEAVKQNVNALDYASERLKDDEQFILKTVKQKGSALRYASNRLQDNEEIVLQAVKQNSLALFRASSRLKDNEQIVLEAIIQSGYLHKSCIPNRFKDDEQFMLKAVKHNSHAFSYASTRLQENELIVLEVMKQNGEALRYVSDRFKDNEQIVLEAVKQNTCALRYASDRLRNDFNFAKQVFTCCNSFGIFERFGDELRNIEFIYYFIENYQSRFHELMRR